MILTGSKKPIQLVNCGYYASLDTDKRTALQIMVEIMVEVDAGNNNNCLQTVKCSQVTPNQTMQTVITTSLRIGPRFWTLLHLLAPWRLHNNNNNMHSGLLSMCQWG